MSSITTISPNTAPNALAPEIMKAVPEATNAVPETNDAVPPIVALHDRGLPSPARPTRRSLKAAIGGTIRGLFTTTLPRTRCHVPMLACVGAVVHIAAAQSLTGVGRFDGGLQAIVYGVSSDGSTAVGYGDSSGSNPAFRWTDRAGMFSLGTLIGGGSIGRAASRDGGVVVGSASFVGGDRAFRWTSAGGMANLGTLAGDSVSKASGVSGDGAVVVGFSSLPPTGGTRPFRWTSADGMVNLGHIPGGTSTFATAVSQDGAVIVGYGYAPLGVRAFRWTGEAGMENLGTLSGNQWSYANAVNSDGSVVVGYCAGDGELPFRWTRSGGMIALGTLPGGNRAIAYGVSANGAIVVGSGRIGEVQHAFLWTCPLGMVDLNQYLPMLGIPLDGWTLTQATGISADGLTIVGYGSRPGSLREGWVARLPSCIADVDDGSGTGRHDGMVTIEDMAFYLLLFAGGARQADVDDGSSTGTPDCGVTIDDLLYYLQRFEAGC